MPAAGVYAITDGQMPSDELFKSVETALAAGIRILQYRRKHDAAVSTTRHAEAQTLLALCQQYNVPFIINDNITLAKELDCGTHIGKDDTGYTNARAELPNAIIGVSCYDDAERALHHAESGADYVAFGAMFPSVTKPHAPAAALSTLCDAKQRLQAAQLTVPIVAIGGIQPCNAGAVIAAGADYLAMVNGLWQHPAGITEAMQMIHAAYADSGEVYSTD